MVINAENQGDWQELDPRSAEKVRETEEDFVVSQILKISRDDIQQLFDHSKSPEDVASEISTTLGGNPIISEQVEEDIATNLEEARRLETMKPNVGVVERLQRQTREFTSAIRRAVPADIFEAVIDDEAFPEKWKTSESIGKTNDLKIDMTHDFWQNRIQNKEELVASLTGLTLADIGAINPVDKTHVIDEDEAEKIAGSKSKGSGTGKRLHKRLLENRARTLLSDEQVSSLNVETAVKMVMDNDNVRKAIVPASADYAQTELNNVVQEKRLVEKAAQLESIEMPTLPTSMPHWQEIHDTIDNTDVDIGTLRTESIKATPTTGKLDSIGVTNVPLSAVGSRQWSAEVASYEKQLKDKKSELQNIQNKFQRYLSALVAIRKDAEAVKNRKSPAVTLLIEEMVNADGTPNMDKFTATNTPQAVMNDLETNLSLRSSAAEYDADIATQKDAVTKAKSGESSLTGRDAVLAVYDNYYRRVKRLDPRRAEEARQTLYARNEQGREEHQARKEAVDDLIGKNDQWSAIHSLRYGRPKTIVKKLARTDAIGASVSSGEVKWSELSYPRLMTAFAALRKLNEDGAETMKLQTTSYFRKQLETVTSLLADKFTEQVERDYAREPETPEQKKERQAQGERNRKQRLLRLLIHNPVPGTYTQRAGVAIADAYKKMHRVRKATSAAAKWSWKNLVVDRAKNVFKGEGHVANPLTYPARGTKGVAKGIWKLLNLEV